MSLAASYDEGLVARTSGRLNSAERVGLFFFLLAMVGFMAQAPVAVVGSFVEAALGMPPQVLALNLAAFFFLCGGRAATWLARGPGRLPLVLGLATLAVVVYRDIGLPGRDGLLRPFQIITGINAYLLTYQLARSEAALRAVLSIAFVLICASGMIALVELVSGFHVEWSTYANSSSSGRSVGLEFSPVPLAYSFATPLTIAVVITLARARSFGAPGRMLTLATIALGSSGLIASASRSGILGVAVGSLTGIILLRGQKRPALLILGVLAGLGLLLAAPQLRAYVWKAGVHGDARLADTWAVYGPVILVRPTGLPKTPYVQGSPVADVSLGDLHRALDDAENTLGLWIPQERRTRALSIPPHNGFLTAGVSYGWVAFGALIGIYGYSGFVGARYSRTRRNLPERRAMVAALVGGILALVIHSFFHNASLFMGEMRNWIYLGLLSGLVYQSSGAPTSATSEPTASTGVSLSTGG